MPTKSKTQLPAIPFAGGLDQPSALSNPDKVLDEMGRLIGFAREQQKPEIVYTAIEKLGAVAELSGKALAWTLYQAYQHWAEIAPDTDFMEAMFEKTGRAPDTLKKYLRAGEFIEDMRERADAPTRKMLLQRNTTDLIALGQVQREHGPLTVAQLSRAAKTTDTAQLRKVLDKVTGRKSRANGVVLFELENDVIMAWRNDKKVPVLKVLTSNDDAGQQLLARVKRKLGVKD